MKKLAVAVVTLFCVPPLLAQQPPADAESDAGRLIPPQVKSGEVLEPEVTIIEEPDRTIEQYSINGHVYMVKITPGAGPAYYLIDSDGDGELDVRSDDPTNIAVPQWVLLSW